MAEITKERIYKLNVEGTESVNELKSAIEQLNEKLKTLNSTSKEYEDTLKELTELQDKLKETIGNIGTSTKKLNDSLKSVEKSAKDTSEGIESIVDAAKGTKSTFTDISDSSKKMKEDLGEVGSVSEKVKASLDNLGKASSMKELKGQIKDLEGMLVQLKTSGEEGGDVWIDVTNRLTEEQRNLAAVTEATKKNFDSLGEAKSVKELKLQISQLYDSLVQLEEGSEQYARTIDTIREKESKLSSVISATKTATTAAKGSYAALQAELTALKAEWRNVGTEAERANLQKRINEIDAALKSMDASVGDFRRHVGDYEGSIKRAFSSPKEEIRALRNELFTLEEGSERYNAVLMRMAELTTQQRKLNEQLRFSSADFGDILGNIAGVAAGITGSFSALYNVMGLIGGESSDMQKAMLTTQRLMGIIQGLSQMEQLRDKIRGLVDGIKSYSNRMVYANKTTNEFNKTTEATSAEAERATGSLNAQASVIQRLAEAEALLTEEEKKAVETTKESIASKEKEYYVLKQEYEQLLETSVERAKYNIGLTDERIEREKAIAAKKAEMDAKEQEIEKYKESLERIEEEVRQRQLARGEIDQETYDTQKLIFQKEKELESTLDEITANKESIKIREENLKRRQEEIDKGVQLSEKEMQRYESAKKSLAVKKQETAELEKSADAQQKEITALKQESAAHVELLSRQKQMIANTKEMGTLRRWAVQHLKAEYVETRNLIKAEKADAAQKKMLAGAYRLVASTARLAATATKTVKTALISSGIGILIVALGSAISNLTDSLGDLWKRITGVAKANFEIDKMTGSIQRVNEELNYMRKIWDAFGYSDFKKQRFEMEKLSEIAKISLEAMNKAIEENSDKIDEMTEKWEDANQALRDSYDDALISVNKLIFEVEKADKQKGMTQLEKDLDDTNRKFEDAIALVRQLGVEGVLSFDVVEAKVKTLNEYLEKQRNLLIENANKDKDKKNNTVDQKKEEAKRLMEALDKESKSEEKKLKDKYEKEKKLLEKYHFDTTKLTEKYYKDLDALMTKNNKESYDKWKAHLDAELQLMQKEYYDFEVTVGLITAEEYDKLLNEGMFSKTAAMAKEIDNLKKDFEYVFGKGVENPFEDFFNIQYLDEFGSKAISISEDIKESMKEMGLDPTNIEDIETMIDKWYLDKKAIEDANVALAKYKSNVKMTEYETMSTRIDNVFNNMNDSLDLEYELLESKSKKFMGLIDGWYDGLSPEQEQEQFALRYQYLETYLQQEYDLWKKASTDETLSVEDRNTAVIKLNEIMIKQQQTAVKKEIDSNNLLIKSFQNISTSISNMANNMASIFGSVAGMIMDTAQRQLEAGEISQEAYEKQFEQAKSYQIAQATINTIAGAVAAFMGITSSSGGWGIAAAAIEAAAVLAAGFAQIAQIRATQPTTSSGGGGGGSSASSSFNLPQVLTPEPPRLENTTSQSDIDTLANALGDQRVYILDSDIQSANNKSNKRRTEVSF